LVDVSTRWVVTHDLAEWKDEIAWMSLYFSIAVWASLALCVCYALGDQLPRYQTVATPMIYPSNTVSAPVTASALSITVRSSDGA